MCKEGISLHRSSSGEPEGMFLHRELRLTENFGSRNGASIWELFEGKQE